jgi:PncC family amidohydrolase
MTLEKIVGELLRARRRTLSVAESCTGGLIGHRLTNVPGSSAYFLGGIIAYSNEIKEQLLGVSHATLTDFGAVSEETAREMARGACRVLGTDIGVAVTGIAGPGGGVPGHYAEPWAALRALRGGRSGKTRWVPSAKPVGLTWIALAAKNFERAERCVWDADRVTNKEKSAETALRLVKEYLEGLS